MHVEAKRVDDESKEDKIDTFASESEEAAPKKKTSILKPELLIRPKS